MKKTRILDGKDLDIVIHRLAHQILEKNKSTKNLCFIGIQRRGVYLAERIKHIIERVEKAKIPFGVMDVTLYRDDLALSSVTPEARKTNLDFDINKKTVILVDDVLFTGRTIRAALDEIMDFGRPKSIQLVVLVDRGNRELPIKPDFTGKEITTSLKEHVKLHLRETDGKDELWLVREE